MSCRRAKIKNLAKKSIENGEDCNDIPDSMRRYLQLQAMESGKGLGGSLLGRAGPMAPYGSGILLNTDTSNSKVGECCPEQNNLNHQRSHLIRFSHSPLCLSLSQHWFMATRGTERHGSCCLLFSREVLRYLLYQ